MDTKQIENFRKAGSIVKQVKEYARTIVKKDASLLELAEKIEKKIIELGGKPAFPITFGINEFTAHVTPTYNDVSKAHGLIKVDFGVAVKGCAADNAFSLDLEDSEENKKLIKASEESLESAIEAVKDKKTIGEIGSNVQKIAEKYNFSSVRNLSGHSISEGNLHAGITIPNFNNNNHHKLDDGIYAIEPFITAGVGEVFDAKPSGIYEIRKLGNIRDSNARKILDYITDEYGTLPFCSRWLIKKFSTRALISLRLMEQAGIIYQFDQLVEKSRSKVSQTEATILVHKGNVEVLT